ncbi:DUF2761 domain-containing protein [Xanthomonas euvesicatoria]|uniref:DUF2761 domain-containing protein n=1 Tax=Xanthomonas euvesicatoria TaxID=456327 RepID=UPI001C496D99|nr:DUF2761 domain-containing protein [Xanthomonas euvesicatoria]MBV6831312.1 DUF2761 domain-containing protein [Xanthomonas campestris pv. viegasii]
MEKQTLPYSPGFVEPTTGRVAVLVRDYAASDLNGDAPAYWYSPKIGEWGLDPWRLVDGVDPHVAGGSFDVCFANGSTTTVGPLMTIFLRADHAQQLALEIDAKGKELALQQRVLEVLAGDLGLKVEALRIESKVPGRPAVFYDRDGMVLCACAVGSEEWQHAKGRVIYGDAANFSG